MTKWNWFDIPTTHGQFRLSLFPANTGPGVVLRSSILAEVPLVRVQSSCLFGEAFDAVNCDCGAQLRTALAAIARFGGCLVYLFQEGRSLGLEAKLQVMAYELNNQVSTDEALTRLGLHDRRRYDTATLAVDAMDIGRRIRLLTDNPNKLAAFRASGYAVTQVVWDAVVRDWVLTPPGVPA